MTNPQQQTSHEPADHSGDGHGFAHPASLPVLYTVFLCLVALTILTVVANGWPLGGFDIWVALGIASVKSLLVALFFMHMYWEKPLNAVIFISPFLFAALFVGMTLMDTVGYRDDVEAFPVSERPDEPVVLE